VLSHMGEVVNGHTGEVGPPGWYTANSAYKATAAVRLSVPQALVVRGRSLTTTIQNNREPNSEGVVLTLLGNAGGVYRRGQ